MFYKLAEHYPDCLMLNFTIKVFDDQSHVFKYFAFVSSLSVINPYWFNMVIEISMMMIMESLIVNTCYLFSNSKYSNPWYYRLDRLPVRMTVTQYINTTSLLSSG